MTACERTGPPTFFAPLRPRLRGPRPDAARPDEVRLRPGGRFLPGRVACVIACLALLSGCGEPGEEEWAGPAQVSDSLYVEIDDDLLTVRARDVTLEALLGEIARRAGLTLMSNGPLDERVTLTLERRPFRQAIGRILRDRGYLLQVAGPLTGRAGGDGAGRRNTLWVFTAGKADNSRSTGRATSAASPGWSGEASGSAGDAGGEDEIASLRLALADADVSVRLEAVTALGSLGDERAAVLLSRALDDADPEVRIEVVRVLGDSGSQMAVPVLQRAMTDTDEDVRSAAVEALGGFDSERAVSALAQGLQDASESVREDTIEALGAIGNEAAESVLHQGLSDDQPVEQESEVDGQN